MLGDLMLALDAAPDRGRILLLVQVIRRELRNGPMSF
jgi:hypothetical protein